MPIETLGNGTRVVNSTRIVLRADGRPKYIIGVVEDVTDRKAAEARLAYLAEHDQLTDLPHGAALQKHLETALEERCCGSISTVSRKRTICLDRASEMMHCARSRIAFA
jgi:hypothetical protein